MTEVSAAALRVGMVFSSADDIPAGMPDGAILIDADEYPWLARQAKDDAWWGDFFPMHLLYIPRDWEGPVEAPEWPVSGTESDAGVVVPVVGHQRSSGSTKYVPIQGWVDDCADCQVPWPCPTVAGLVAAGTDTPTQEGYQQMMRQKSMAAHPAGSGLRSTADVPAGKARG